MRRLRIRDVAEALGVHRNTALAMVRNRQIPGGELLYKLDDGREKWAVDAEVFRAWRAANAADAATTANLAVRKATGTK